MGAGDAIRLKPEVTELKVTEGVFVLLCGNCTSLETAG